MTISLLEVSLKLGPAWSWATLPRLGLLEWYMTTAADGPTEASQALKRELSVRPVTVADLNDAALHELLRLGSVPHGLDRSLWTILCVAPSLAIDGSIPPEVMDHLLALYQVLVLERLLEPSAVVELEARWRPLFKVLGELHDPHMLH